ncbi:hypothetical protein ID866_5060, partial [Astraeus odoratus]
CAAGDSESFVTTETANLVQIIQQIAPLPNVNKLAGNTANTPSNIRLILIACALLVSRRR